MAKSRAYDHLLLKNKFSLHCQHSIPRLLMTLRPVRLPVRSNKDFIRVVSAMVTLKSERDPSVCTSKEPAPCPPVVTCKILGVHHFWGAGNISDGRLS